MPVDPQIQKILDLLAPLPPLHTLSVADARVRMEKRPAEGLRIAPVAAVADRIIVRPGGSLPLRIYTPIGTGPFPIIAFFHGSGFVVCSLDTHDSMCRNLCGGSGAVVVSVDYRLAPENKFPAGLDDCLLATRWIGEHAAELNGDASRIVVAGDSAMHRRSVPPRVPPSSASPAGNHPARRGIYFPAPAGNRRTPPPRPTHRTD